MSKDDANFLARQIVDDLIRAGLPATRYQHVVEETLLQWAVKKMEKSPSVSMGCPIPKVECPTCKQEVHPPHIPKSMLRACLFCGEDHAYHECPEYPEQLAVAMKEGRESEEKMKEDLALDKEDK